MDVRYLQEGGQMAPEQAPAGGDPMQQLVSMAQQALQNNDPNMAMQVCQMIMDLASGGQAAPGGGQEPAPEEEAPAGEPVYRRGGRLVRRDY
jgi:hypothetical protein